MTRHINADWSNHVAAAGRHLLHLPPRPAGAGRDLVPQHAGARQAASSPSRSTGAKPPTRCASSSPTPAGRNTSCSDEPIAAQSITALPSQHRRRADRGQAHLRDDDADVGRHRRQLRLLPQLARLHELGAEHAVPLDRHYAIEQVRDLNRNYLLKLGHQMPMTRNLVGETRIPVLPGQRGGPADRQRLRRLRHLPLRAAQADGRRQRDRGLSRPVGPAGPA